MKYTVNKKLFKKVMCVDLSHKFNLDTMLESVKENNIHVFFYLEKDTKCFHLDSKSISVNDFFFKCNKWAFEQGFVLRSWIGHDLINLYSTKDRKIGFCKIGVGQRFSAETQQQALFEACEWIYNEIYKE